MLSTATHSKMREALDGTDTQVATYAINRWTAKMKGAEEYITREISQIMEGNSEDTKKLYWWSIRGGEKELILERGPRTDFDYPPTTLLTILLPNNPARPLTRSSQRPNS